MSRRPVDLETNGRVGASGKKFLRYALSEFNVLTQARYVNYLTNWPQVKASSAVGCCHDFEGQILHFSVPNDREKRLG